MDICTKKLARKSQPVQGWPISFLIVELPRISPQVIIEQVLESLEINLNDDNLIFL